MEFAKEDFRIVVENKMESNKKLKSDEDQFADETSEVTLNHDCLVRIFEYLPIADRVRLERVCTTWYQASQASWHTFKHLDNTEELWGSAKGRRITMSMLEKVFERCGNYLTHFKVSNKKGYKVMSDAIVKPLAKSPNLTSVSLLTRTVDEEDLEILMKNCKYLKELNFGVDEWTENVATDDLISRIFLKYTDIKVFKMSSTGNHCIRGSCWVDLSETIEELSMEECKSLDFGLFAQNIKRFCNLKKLSLAASIERINNFDFLKQIDLRELDISYNGRIRDNHLISIARACENLSSIKIHELMYVTNEGVAAVSSLPNLENLGISELSKITDEALKIMPRLKFFNCKNTKISDAALIRILHTSPNIREINCSGCKKVSNKFIETVVDVVKSRTNGVPLKIIAKRTRIKFSLKEIFAGLKLEL